MGFVRRQTLGRVVPTTEGVVVIKEFVTLEVIQGKDIWKYKVEKVREGVENGIYMDEPNI